MRNQPPPPRVFASRVAGTSRVDATDRIETSRVADPGRGPAIVALIAVVFVVAASASSLLADGSGRVAAPDSLTASPNLANPSADAPAALPNLTPASPPPTVEPSLRPGEIACMPAGWRLAYLGSLGRWTTQTWLVVDPAAASNPLDPSIPVTQLGHEAIAGLGACAPPASPDAGGRPAVIQRAWRVGRAGGSESAQPIVLVILATPAGPTLTPTAPQGRPDALALVRPAGSAASWAPGDYVLEIGPPGAVGPSAQEGRSSWLRIELDAPTP